MLIECLIQRDGSTHVTLRGVRYEFKKNGLGHSVCDVTSNDHLSWFLSFPNSYRVYQNPTEAKKEEAEGHEGKRTHRKRVEDHH